MLGLTSTIPVLLAMALASGAGVAFLGRLVSSTVRRRRGSSNGVLILGTNQLAADVIGAIEARKDDRFRVIGVVDDSADGHGVRGVTPLLCRLNQSSQVVAVTRPSHIVIAMADRRGRIPDGLLLESRFRGVIVEEAVDFLERITGKLAIESIRPSSLILSTEFRHVDLGHSSAKRALWRIGNFMCAVLGLGLTAPLMALIALAIRLDSSGSVCFVQDRVGRGGKPFALIKFRTMRDHVGARTSEWVSDNTSRITRVGKWLRRFRLDELPQLVNVARGEMNLVGPRPHPVSNHQLFLRNIPYYGVRCMVRPGITGWAQVRHGYANGLAEEIEKMRYDLYYLKHGCLLFDIQIVVETLRLLLFDRRSHERARHRISEEAWSDAGVRAIS